MAAMKMAGYARSGRMAIDLEANETIKAAIEDAQAKNLEESHYTRAEAVKHLIAGVEIAIKKADSMGIARCVAELNKMHGYLAPEKKEIEVKIPQLTQMKQLERLTDEQLVEMLGPEGMTIEGQYEIVDENVQDVLPAESE